MSSLLAITEVGIDFLQIFQIIFEKLEGNIHGLLRYSFFGFSEIFTIDLSGLFSMHPGTNFIIEFIVMVILVAYQSQRRHQGLQAALWQESSKFQRNLARAIIFCMTTLYLPLSRWCIIIILKIPKYYPYFENKYSSWVFLSVVVLLINLIMIPFYFYQAIQWAVPEVAKFDSSGVVQAHQRISYQKNLKRVNSPFKAVFGEYYLSGAYFKLFMMLKKFVLMILFIIQPTSRAGNIVQYVIFLLIESGYIYAVHAKRPYLSDDANVEAIQSSISNAFCLVLNLIAADAITFDKNQYTIIAIIQLIITIIGFCSILIEFLLASDQCRVFTQKLLKKLQFTKISDRGIFRKIFNKKGNMRYIVFNKEVLDAELEIKLGFWQQIWSENIFKEEKFASQVPLNQLGFINSQDTPPYLKNFSGKLEQRHEENIRIAEQVTHPIFFNFIKVFYKFPFIQKIGLTKYQDYIQQFKNPEFMTLVQHIYLNLNGVDVYYPDTKNKSASNFGKLIIVPFPFMIGLSYDDCQEMDYFDKYDDIKRFVDQNNLPNVIIDKRIRLDLRSLNGVTIYHYIQNRETRTQSRHRGGKIQHYSVGAWIEYFNPVLQITTRVSTQKKLRNGSEIEIGPGFLIKLSYSSGKGIDDEGAHFENGGKVFDQVVLGMPQDSFVKTNQVIELLNQNAMLIQQHKNNVAESYQNYRQECLQEVVDQNSVMTYEFFTNIYNADMSDIMNQSYIQEQLAQERNPDLKNIIQTHSILTQAYEKFALFQDNPQLIFKFIFFNDLWYNNKDISTVADQAGSLNPISDNCFCYQENLENQFAFKEAFKSIHLGSYMKDSFIDGYFEMLEFYQNRKNIFNDGQYQQYNPIIPERSNIDITSNQPDNVQILDLQAVPINNSANSVNQN